jgi:hypothetical protein
MPRATRHERAKVETNTTAHHRAQNVVDFCSIRTEQLSLLQPCRGGLLMNIQWIVIAPRQPLHRSAQACSTAFLHRPVEGRILPHQSANSARARSRSVSIAQHRPFAEEGFTAEVGHLERCAEKPMNDALGRATCNSPVGTEVKTPKIPLTCSLKFSMARDGISTAT